MKKHYVTKWEHANRLHVFAACGVFTATWKGSEYAEATYRKNHVTCKNCRRTKVFRGVR